MDESSEARRVRGEFRWIAIFTAAGSVFIVLLGIVNGFTGFLGGWIFTVAPIVFGLAGVRGGWLVWMMRDRVAAGHARLAKADQQTRQAVRQRANRSTAAGVVAVISISIAGAAIAGFTGVFVSMLATLIVLELAGFIVSRRERRSAPSSE